MDARGRSRSRSPKTSSRFACIRSEIVFTVARVRDMSRSAVSSLSGEQQETWLAYMRVVLRLNYEMNRQLQTDSDLSLADYDVLNALADVPDGRLQVTELAARIGWERSRVSHHVRRMGRRGLVELAASATDRRAGGARPPP